MTNDAACTVQPILSTSLYPFSVHPEILIIHYSDLTPDPSIATLSLPFGTVVVCLPGIVSSSPTGGAEFLFYSLTTLFCSNHTLSNPNPFFIQICQVRDE